MKPIDHQGETLDSEFDVERGERGLEVILHARYGGRNSPRATNVDYFTGLELLLGRLAAASAVIHSVTVDSTVALKLPWADRLLDLSYPVELQPASDVGELRLAITRAQRTVARDPTAGPRGGNNHKRIRISVSVGTLREPAELAGLLVNGSSATPRRQVGADYRTARPDPSVAPADLFTFDPAVRERGLSAHADVQNSLADFLRSHGITPLSPRPSEPDFDIAWQAPGVVVAEVKSLTGANEDRQLRLGLGRLLHYRHLLAATHGAVSAVLAVEHEPDGIWRALCSELDIRLSWPPEWPSLP